jgi:hypothetical protein
MRNKILMLCGIFAPVAYVVVVIFGGILRPGYSHLSDAVSELIATGAPNKSLLDLLFALYNLLVLAFAFGLFLIVRSENQGKVTGTFGSIFLILEGIFGLITIFFSQDPGGVPTTFTGTMHIVLAGLSSLTSMLATLLMGFWFKNISYLRRFSTHPFMSVAIVFLSGGLAAASVAAKSPFGGLLERVTIGGFLQWLFVIALNFYSSEKTNVLLVKNAEA